ncbi:hypothetical protein [Haloechinothrix salitolerans]|uniref:Uncharacterized protein n=1 Tax=Haloechinothrix salitolerans TaxID=926830 RepID=A0ABW2BWZ8_9PSEU
MEWAEVPLAALYLGSRHDRERAAIGLLDRAGWLRCREVASCVTVTVGGDGLYDDESAIATIDWDGVAQSFEDMPVSDNTHQRAQQSVLAVACSLASGHRIDLGEVADALRHRPDKAAWAASTVLCAAGHDDHVVRWPQRPQLPRYVRIVAATGDVIQDPGDAPQRRWHEIGAPWLRSDTDS